MMVKIVKGVYNPYMGQRYLGRSTHTFLTHNWVKPFLEVRVIHQFKDNMCKCRHNFACTHSSGTISSRSQELYNVKDDSLSMLQLHNQTDPSTFTTHTWVSGTWEGQLIRSLHIIGPNHSLRSGLFVSSRITSVNAVTTSHVPTV